MDVASKTGIGNSKRGGLVFFLLVTFENKEKKCNYGEKYGCAYDYGRCIEIVLHNVSFL